MRHLITGGAGFIGSHLCEQLIAAGDDVLVLDDLSTGRYENVAALDGGGRFRFILGSVNDADLVTECVRQCDAVMHLASAVGVRLIIDQPVRTIETIVSGTDTVLRTCARYRKPVLITSTSEVYGKSEKLPFREEDDRVMGPTTQRRWSYACAKALDEFLALAHWYEYRLPVVIVRLFNTVGPRQTGQYGMVVPRFVRQGLCRRADHRVRRREADALLRARARRGRDAAEARAAPGRARADLQHRQHRGSDHARAGASA